MWAHHGDILERIDTPPLWFDEYAVPRYVPFAPNRTANIHAGEAVLALIACQDCGHAFEVAFTRAEAAGDLSGIAPGYGGRVWLADLIRAGKLSYGDPPNVGCCETGAFTSSVMKRVLEYWYKPMTRGEFVVKDSRGHNRIADLRATEFRRDPTLDVSFQT